MDEIGSVVPRGVVDVQKDFVGIEPQQMNPHKELARLRRQVRHLRNRARDMGLLSADAEPQTNRISRVLVMAGLAAIAFALWRSQAF